MENFLINYLSKRYKNFEFEMIDDGIYIINNRYIKGVEYNIGKCNYDDWQGKYLIPVDDKYLAIDNSTSDCWCEEFRKYQTALDWLNERFEVQ